MQMAEIRMQKLDPVMLAVVKGRLEQIADEMDATLFRSAFNPIIAEAHDASHGLYHAITGETLIQGKSGLPVFVGAMSFAVKMVIDKVIGLFVSIGISYLSHMSFNVFNFTFKIFDSFNSFVGIL